MEAGIRNRVSLGRRRLPPCPRRDQAPVHGRQPGRLRHPRDSLARLHDLPRLPAGHLPCRHCDPDRDAGGGHRARAEGFRAPRRSARPPRAAPASSPRWSEEVRSLTAELGYERTQDLVGRYVLLEQVAHRDEIDLSELSAASRSTTSTSSRPTCQSPTRSRSRRALKPGLVRARPIADGAEAGLGADRARRAGRAKPRRAPGSVWATDANDRVLGAELSGAISRARIYDNAAEGSEDVLASFEFNGSSIASQGFGAFNA